MDLVEDTYDEIDSFRAFIEEVHLYRCLVSQLPEKVSFPMFEVGLLQVKTELKSRVESLLYLLLSKFEWDLFR